MPSDPNERNIIVRKPFELSTHVLGQNNIISRMTEGVIASAKSHELTQARYKVGKHELARNDYEVVRYWSREL